MSGPKEQHHRLDDGRSRRSSRRSWPTVALLVLLPRAARARVIPTDTTAKRLGVGFRHVVDPFAGRDAERHPSLAADVGMRKIAAGDDVHSDDKLKVAATALANEDARDANAIWQPDVNQVGVADFFTDRVVNLHLAGGHESESGYGRRRDHAPRRTGVPERPR